MNRYRHSALQMLRCCGFAYKRAYLDRAPGSASPSLTAGSNVHRAIGVALRRLVETGMVDLHDVAYRTVQGGGIEYADAIAVLTRFQEALGIEFDVVPERVLFLEERLELPVELPDGTMITFGGTPDLVERTGPTSCRITDWKTHWVPETREQFEADDQLRRYAMLVNHALPAMRQFELVKRFVRWSENAHIEQLDAADLRAVRDRLVTEIVVAEEREAAGDFEPTGGAWCAVCSHTHACPLVRPYREVGLTADPLTVDDDERARSLASDAIALDAAAGALKARLKRYLGGEHRNGRVPVAGGEYGYGPVNHRRIDEPELREILERYGLQPPDGLFRVDLTVLDRLLRRIPEQAVQEIDAAVHHWQSSECRFRRTTATSPAPPVAAAAQGDLL